MSIVFGSAQTRITLYNSSGVATFRITLQGEKPEGLVLTFKPEGVEHLLGSGAGWARRITPRGFRPVLSIVWDQGLTSSIETWSGSAWGAAVSELTAQSLGRIESASMVYPCLVEPHKDNAFSFTAQPDLSKPLGLRDLKKLFHTGLALDLLSTTLISAIPVW